jgi:hypothetical protein
MKAPFEIRPTCSCGVKMKLVEYEGYYDGFRYWICENCDMENKLYNYEPDDKLKGAYA